MNMRHFRSEIENIQRSGNVTVFAWENDKSLPFEKKSFHFISVTPSSKLIKWKYVKFCGTLFSIQYFLL